MLTSFESINWDYLRYFAALAEHGSLYGAARALGTSHSTVGRNISLLEQRLGLRLFDKIDNRYWLNADGKRILERVRAIRSQIFDIGTVLDLDEPHERDRLPLAATVFVAENLLPLILGDVFQSEIALSVDAVIGQDFSPVTDEIYPLAISQHRIGRPNWRTRALGELRTAFYCTAEYRASTQAPITRRLLRSHRFAVWSDVLRSSDARCRDLLGNLENCAVLESDALHLVLRTVLDGRAIGTLPALVAADHNELIPVLEDVAIESLTIWAHINERLEQTTACRKLLADLAATLAGLSQANETDQSRLHIRSCG